MTELNICTESLRGKYDINWRLCKKKIKIDILKTSLEKTEKEQILNNFYEYLEEAIRNLINDLDDEISIIIGL